MKKRITTALSAGLLALGISVAAGAAQPGTTAQGAAPAAEAPMRVPTPNYSDAQLERFVTASREIAMISQEYSPKLQATADEATKEKVFKEADDKMVKAVHEQGMTVDQFNGINQALQQDPTLVQRIQKVAE